MSKKRTMDTVELIDELCAQVDSLSRRLEIKEKREKQLIKENNKLKKQVHTVNFFEKNEDLKEFLSLKREEVERDKKIKHLLEKWKCFSCGRGTLHIHTFFISGEKHYYRNCNFCEHRTKAKEYDERVKGLFFEDIENI